MNADMTFLSRAERLGCLCVAYTIPIYEQDVEGERRFVYYGETIQGRFLAAIVTERADAIRVVTAYDLDAGQRRDYVNRRAQGE
jgi:uncharacterized DUF497 family protein